MYSPSRPLLSRLFARSCSVHGFPTSIFSSTLSFSHILTLYTVLYFSLSYSLFHCTLLLSLSLLFTLSLYFTSLIYSLLLRLLVNITFLLLLYKCSSLLSPFPLLTTHFSYSSMYAFTLIHFLTLSPTLSLPLPLECSFPFDGTNVCLFLLTCC